MVLATPVAQLFVRCDFSRCRKPARSNKIIIPEKSNVIYSKAIHQIIFPNCCPLDFLPALGNVEISYRCWEMYKNLNMAMISQF